MSGLFFHNATVIGGRDPAGTTLAVANGTIVADAPPGAEPVDLGGGYLLPGFVDTQVNGGGGVLFNDDPSVETIARIGAAHRRFGTTSFLPTLISDHLDTVDQAMRATEQAIADGVPGVAGVHLEGPFLNPARRGTHDAARFLRLDEAAIRLLSSLRAGRTLVTLAPEMCTPDDIRALVAAGVIVAIGHSDADLSTARDAFAAGASGVTHLFNAMSPLGHRAPGVVGATLDDPAAYAGIIVDGHHVDPVALRIALRCRPIDRFMLVTDAMPSVGSANKRFRLQGHEVHAEGGVCVNGEGVLAGSDLDMATAVANTVRLLGRSLADAATMASSAPARFLRLADRGTLVPGLRADLVWLDAELRLRGVWIGGVAEPLHAPA